jgi:hypothetical protein
VLADAPSPRRRPPTRLLVLLTIAAIAGVVAVVVDSSAGAGSPSTGFVNPLALTNVPPPQQLPMSQSQSDAPGSPVPFAAEVPAHFYVSMTFPYDVQSTDWRLLDTSSPPPYGGPPVPPAGAVEIEIEDLGPPAVTLTLGLHAASDSPLRLASYFHVPRGATDVVRSVPPHLTKFAGLPAGGETYTYRYAGRRDVATELVASRAGHVVWIEVDAEPSVQRKAQAALRAFLGGWRWLTPAQAARAARPPALPRVPPTGPLPRGQWLASGFVDSLNGDFADETLDQRELRAWDFKRVCTSASRCHTEMINQFRDGRTTSAPVSQEPGHSWYQAVFPPDHTTCAREPSRPTRKETVYDTVDFGWTPHGRTLVGEETQTVIGCDANVPATAGDGWTATRVPAAPALSISPNPAHVATAAAFRAAATRACTRLNQQALPISARVGAAERALHSTTNRELRAQAEVTIAAQLRPLLAFEAEEYDRISQPPSGPLDQLWLRDIEENRLQLAPGSAAMNALAAAMLATARYLRSGRSLDAQAVVAEGTLYAQDLAGLRGPALASQRIEQVLRLPAICTSPPALSAIFSAPTSL